MCRRVKKQQIHTEDFASKRCVRAERQDTAFIGYSGHPIKHFACFFNQHEYHGVHGYNSRRWAYTIAMSRQTHFSFFLLLLISDCQSMLRTHYLSRSSNNLMNMHGYDDSFTCYVSMVSSPSVMLDARKCRVPIIGENWARTFFQRRQYTLVVNQLHGPLIEFNLVKTEVFRVIALSIKDN